MEAVIVSAPKDYTKLSFCIDHLNKNVFPKITKIFIITPTKIDLKSKDIDIVNYLDNEVISFDRNKIKYRPNWQFSQYLKLFQNITKDDKYLVVDADHFLVSKFNIYNEKKQPYFFLTNDQNAKEYFNFSNKIFNVGRSYNHSFISEIMLFDKNIIDNMISSTNFNRKNIYDFMAINTDSNCHLSEYELYGNYVEINYPNFYEKKYIKQFRVSYRWDSYKQEELQQLIDNFYKYSSNNAIDSIRIDTYDL